MCLFPAFILFSGFMSSFFFCFSSYCGGCRQRLRGMTDIGRKDGKDTFRNTLGCVKKRYMLRHKVHLACWDVYLAVGDVHLSSRDVYLSTRDEVFLLLRVASSPKGIVFPTGVKGSCYGCLTGGRRVAGGREGCGASDGGMKIAE